MERPGIYSFSTSETVQLESRLAITMREQSSMVDAIDFPYGDSQIILGVAIKHTFEATYFLEIDG